MQFQKIIEETKNLNTLMPLEEREVLYRYAKKVKSGGVIVDIGTCTGNSAFMMAGASKPDVTIYTIDPVVNPQFEEYRKKLDLEYKVIFINMTSEEAFKEWDREIDMLFVDGVHSYAGVKNDFDTFGSKVKEGGIIAFHDVLLYGNTIGQCVKDLITEGKIEEIETIHGKERDNREVGLLVSRKLCLSK